MGGGLWGALSSAATPLATAAGANQQGIQQGNEINTGNLLDTVKLYQQQAATQLARQEAQSKMALEGAQAQAQLAAANSARRGAFQYDPTRGVSVNPTTGEVVTPQGLPQPEDKETFNTENVLVGGKPAIIQRGNKGTIKGLDNTPIDPKNITPYVDPNSSPKGSYQQDKDGNFIWLPAGGGKPVNYGVQGAPKGGGAGGQTRLPERTQQLGLALQNAGSVLPIHQSFATDGPGLFAGMGGAVAQEGGAKGQAANWMLNKTGNDKYNQYLNGMDGLLLAVAHSVGGARINKEQIHMFGQNMVQGAGDTAAQNQQKLQSVIGFMNSARSTLPPEAVAAQEAQLAPSALAYLRSLGYGGPPTNEGLALVAKFKELGGETDTPSAPPPATSSRTPTFEEWQASRRTP